MNLKKYKYFFLISFLLPMVMMLYWYYLAGIFPFGNKSVIVGDLSNQYLAILAYFKNNFFHPSNLLYSFKFGLGGNFFPVIAYYLVSPLNLLALFFPTKDLIGFFTLNLVFNSGWAGMMMFYFLIKSHWLNRGTTQLKPKFMSLILALSTAYALSSFYIANAHCFMWFNAIAVLPLVVLGLDRLYFKDKANLYWISYVYLLLVNYYIGYMTTIFLALLTIFFAISSMMFKDREPKKIIISLLKILMYTVLSLLSSLIVFLPSWLAQKAVTQEKMKYQYLPLFKSFDGLANLFPKVSVNNAPFLYTSLLVLLLAITFFFSKKISEKERNLTGIFALLIFISVWLSAFYQIWHVFTMPNGYPSRESFVLIFSIVCLAYRALCVQLEERSFRLAPAFWILTFLLGFFAYFTQYFSGLLILEIISTLLIYWILFSMCFSKNKQIARFIPILILFFTLFELNFVYKSSIAHQVKRSYRVSSFSDIYQGTKKTLDQVAAKNHGFYRVATTYQINPNDPLLFNYNGVQNYLSQQPTKETNFLSAAGYFQKHSWIRWSTYNNGSTLAMDSLLGINYLLANNSQHLNRALNQTSSLAAFNSTYPQYFEQAVIKHGTFTVFKNQLAFPLIFKGNESANRIKVNYSTSNDPFKFQNTIFAGLTRQRNIFKDQVTNFETTVDQYRSSFKAIQTGYAYLYLPTNINVNPARVVKVYVNGKFVTQAYGYSFFAENGIICLGKFKKGMPITVSIEGKNITSQFTGTPIIAIENRRELNQVYQVAVDNSQIKIKKIQGTKINFTTTSAFKNGFAILSLPYDQGWQVKVDGKPAKLKQVLGELSGIHLKSGVHSITMHYRIAGLMISSIISGLALCSLIWISIWKKKRLN